jgi:hypothetical protein
MGLSPLGTPTRLGPLPGFVQAAVGSVTPRGTLVVLTTVSPVWALYAM